MVIALLAAVAVPLAMGSALMAADRLGRPLGHSAAWLVAMLTAAVSLGASVAAAVSGAELDERWVPQLGMRLHLTIDGVSAPLVILSAAVTLLAVAVSARQRPTGTPGLFYGCLLVVLGGAVAAFTAHDVIAFFIAFEVVLVPMWVLIDRFGDRSAEPRRAGWMFALYTITGSMVMLAGLLVLVTATGTSDMDAMASAARSLPFSTTLFAGVLLTVGLAVKVPLVGVHSWLPRAHTAAPTAGSMVLAAILLKLGTYGFVRLVVLMLPSAWRTIAPVVGVLAVVGIVVGGLVCLAERDLKRLVAWSSIAHMGFVMLALAAGQEVGLQAALYGNVAHGVISALLFAVVGILKTRRGGMVDLEVPMVGLRRIDPRLGFVLVVAVAAAIGLPGLAGFWGEILALFAAWGAPHRPAGLFHVLTLVAAFGAVLAAAYGMRILRLVWAGEGVDDVTVAGATPASVAGERPHGELAAHPDDGDGAPLLTGLDALALGLLVLVIVVLGLVPTLLMHVADDDLSRLLGGLA